MFGIRSETTPAYHPEANGMVERWHRTLKNSISCDRQSDKNWASRLPMILLGLRARPHLDSSLSPHQQAFGTELTLPANFASKEEEELDGVEFSLSPSLSLTLSLSLCMSVCLSLSISPFLSLSLYFYLFISLSISLSLFLSFLSLSLCFSL